MRQFKTVFKFEYTNYIKNKSFLAVTAVLLLLVVILSGIPIISNAVSSFTGGGDETQNEKPQKNAALYDVNGEYSKDALAAYFPDYDWIFLDSLEGVEEMITEGELELVAEIDGLTYKLYKKGTSLLSSSDENTLAAMIKNTYQTLYLTDAGLTADEALEVLAAAPSGEVVPVGKDINQSYAVSYIIIIVMYMVTIMYGMYVLTSVVTEKSSRAMELLITSAKPFQLMFGKVMGVGAAGLSQFGLILLTAFAFLKLNYAGWLEFSPGVAVIVDMVISSNVLIYALVYFLLAFFSFAFVYAGLGSTVSRMEDANTVTWIPMMLLVAAYMIALVGGVSTPEATYIKVCSFVPFLSPLVMFMRIAVADIPLTEILLSIGVNVLYIFGLAFVSSKIYRVGVMLYGMKPNMKEIAKFIVKA